VASYRRRREISDDDCTGTGHGTPVRIRRPEPRRRALGRRAQCVQQHVGRRSALGAGESVVRPLWDTEHADADAYFGKVLRDAAKATRLGRSQTLKAYFLSLEIWHKIEIHHMTGRVIKCTVDEMKRLRERSGRRCEFRLRRCSGAALEREA
jgi:hypothetical protein